MHERLSISQIGVLPRPVQRERNATKLRFVAISHHALVHDAKLSLDVLCSQAELGNEEAISENACIFTMERG
jgi:hypothetical protein